MGSCPNQDGVPGVGQDPIKPGQTYTYDFTVVEWNGEVIGVGLARLDGVLPHTWHTVLVGRDFQAVPVQGGRLWEMVGNRDTQVIACRHTNGWPWDCAVQCPGEHARMSMYWLPHHLLGGKVKHLRSISRHGVLCWLRAIVLRGVGHVARGCCWVHLHASACPARLAGLQASIHQDGEPIAQ